MSLLCKGNVNMALITQPILFSERWSMKGDPQNLTHKQCFSSQVPNRRWPQWIMSMCLKNKIFLADKYDEIISWKQVPSARIVFSPNRQKQVCELHLEILMYRYWLLKLSRMLWKEKCFYGIWQVFRIGFC